MNGQVITVLDVLRDERYLYFTSTLRTPIIADGSVLQIITQIITEYGEKNKNDYE